ncbi:MAG: copper chaperone PCu(A)C [Betaproteobacteria bacterium]
MKNKLSILALALLVCGSAMAQPMAERVEASGAWVRALPPGSQVTGAFMILKNNADKEALLVKAESPASRVAELHEHANDNGVMKMRPVAGGIVIKSKGEVALKPGGYHVMLIDLKAPLKEGDTVPLTLGFGDGSSKKIDARVSKMPAQEGHMH